MALAIFVFFKELCDQPYLVHAFFFFFNSSYILISIWELDRKWI